ncbi:D-alanine--D-alanine ligase family protein [Vagococcus elongatus]|uniref:D-alanine--D-alanine ligase n=1 Tax=Vagococcus elongatus TaxID=180344 RepID=A0A430B226_9ENTE|nr:D-alanine--D-alanine ligase [Vagococcus elongatus]RSU14358.1 D-alanine--D-alanine ligase [Vagococcus elongatus]
MNIVVLAGGYSDERDVSLSSGSMIANALIKKNHRVLLVDPYVGLKNIANFEEGFKRYEQKAYSYQVPIQAPDLEKIKAEQNNQEELIGPNVLALCQTADVVFPALHGGMGENGQLQALLDIFNISYTGTGFLGSALAMDKKLSKELFLQHQIPTPASFSTDGKEQISFPCVIKPNNSGSSIGVKIVQTEQEFFSALAEAKNYDSEPLIEETITGREFSVGILDGEVLPIIEIQPKTGFYDYANKYQEGAVEESCPADLSKEKTLEMQRLALKVHQVLRLGTYARIDFMMDQAGAIFCIEANTLPGMTPTSLLPQEALAAGISYEDLCEKIVHLALKK